MLPLQQLHDQLPALNPMFWW